MLSIVTINKDNRIGLQKTINSLQSLGERNYQWICIDSVSTDGSVELANQFMIQDDVVISEIDTGIYNAMNKGISLARGDYILFLNSGDILSPQIKSLDFMKVVAGHDLALFGFEIRNTQRKPRANGWRFWSMPTSHQAIVYSNALLKQNPFDETYRFAADFEHYLRINRTHLSIYSDDRALIVNEPYGSDAHLPVLLGEYRHALIKNGYPKLWAHFVYWMKTYYLKWALRERS
ncbi:glycosyltransferase [Polynucleobacter sp. IMCC 29146]|uniref:glycosyltransferase n=1 Tax=Polynucleobacter sp. IMCC 29146 TaxID=2780953 RepID=UPI001F39812A|nr:glycosyltransferase [Polynucleobacter sp. IMCC 29146]MCE7530512.1 glycosyltransferase [Polynucleobacter sp. IMCC 29146]